MVETVVNLERFLPATLKSARSWSRLNHPHAKPCRALALIGSAYTAKHAPLNDRNVDVWALNTVAPVDSCGRIRADRWFEIHDKDVRDQARWKYMQLVAARLPVMTLDPRLTWGTPFPMSELLAQGYRDYFTCTFAYQLAYALYRGYQHIGLYGCHLFTGTAREATTEAACVSYWLGVAEGRGIRLTIPESPFGLLRSLRYGGEDERLLWAAYVAARKQVALDERTTPVGHGALLTDIFGRA